MARTTTATNNPDVLLNEERKRKAARQLRKALRSPALAPMYTQRVRERYPFCLKLTEYIEEVTQNPKRHNLYEQLAVLTFVRKLERYEWVPELVHRFIRFYEILPFEGTQGVASYRMTRVQVFIVANIFGLHTRNRQGERIRLHRDVYLFVPRKFAKTTLAAAIAVWFMLFEDFNSQAFTIANSFQQARICFDMQRSIMQYLDPEQKMFRVNRETITFTNKAERNARASKSVCLSANPKNLDGLFAELVIRDEGAQARDTATKSGSDLKNVLTSSEGPRKQPLNIDISTASEVVDGPFHREIIGVKDVLLSVIE